MKRQTKKDREEKAWQKLKEAFPGKYVSLHLHRVRYSNKYSCKSEIYVWRAIVDYGGELIKMSHPSSGCLRQGATPTDAVDNLIREVKFLLKEKEDEK